MTICFLLLSTKVFGCVLQYWVQNSGVGAVGTLKHWVLMYLFGLPGFVSVLHPGPPRRAGKAQSSLLPEFDGSPPVPQVPLNGTPSLAVKMSPSCHPFVAHLAGPENDLGEGTSQVPFRTKVRPILKSDSPRFDRMS